MGIALRMENDLLETGDELSNSHDQQGDVGQREHDEWVMGALERYERDLTDYAMHMTGNTERARDVVQETFLRLCKASRAEIGDRIAAWLFSVCRTRALDMLRKEKRLAPLPESFSQTKAGRDADPRDTYELKVTANRALQLMKSLPNQQQEAIRLKFQHGLSYKEISDVTGMSVASVGFQIHMGLKELRAAMANI